MGYRDTTFSFLENGKHKQINLIFAPNGAGKTSLLTAIDLAYNAQRMEGRDSSLLLRKSVFNKDYDPAYENLKGTYHNDMEMSFTPKDAYEMLIHAKFKTESGGSAEVIINNNGVVKNDITDFVR